MNALTAPVAVLALALAFAGASKLVDPATTTGALRAAGLPAHDVVVRLGAAIEVAVAVAVLVSGSRPALVALAVSYAGFTLFVALALRGDRPLATCGCVGRADSPPSRLHVGLDGVATAVTTAVVAGRPASLLHVVTTTSTPTALACTALVATGAGLFLASLTILPVALALRAPTRA